MSILLSPSGLAIAEHSRGISGTGGTSGGGGAGGGGGGGVIPGNLTAVTPVSAMWMHKFWGLQGNPTRTDQVYAGNPPKTYSQANVDAWTQLYANAGFSWVRARYNPNHAGTKRMVTRARTLGLKVLWTTVPEAESGSDLPTDQTIAETRAVIKDIALNAADVTLGIEGLNEPNHNRNGTPVKADWATNAVYGAVPHQKAISTLR